MTRQTFSIGGGPRYENFDVERYGNCNPWFDERAGLVQKSCGINSCGSKKPIRCCCDTKEDECCPDDEKGWLSTLLFIVLVLLVLYLIGQFGLTAEVAAFFNSIGLGGLFTAIQNVLSQFVNAINGLLALLF